MPLHIEKDSRGIVTVWLDNAARRNAMDDSMLGDGEAKHRPKSKGFFDGVKKFFDDLTG